MAKYLIEDSTIESIAEAARAKLGTEDKLLLPTGIIEALQLSASSGGEFKTAIISTFNKKYIPLSNFIENGNNNYMVIFAASSGGNDYYTHFYSPILSSKSLSLAKSVDRYGFSKITGNSTGTSPQYAFSELSDPTVSWVDNEGLYLPERYSIGTSVILLYVG